MVKLLRNHIMDDGLRLPSGAVIDGSVFTKLLAADNAEFRLCHKLTVAHITVRFIVISLAYSQNPSKGVRRLYTKLYFIRVIVINMHRQAEWQNLHPVIRFSNT